MNPDQANVILVGFMGTGKSVVGRILAERLRRPLFDTDDWVVRRAGRSIPEIFQRDGEGAFRDLESQAVAVVARPCGMVVSTGGGVLVRDENLRMLRAGGVLIGLQASPEIILRRTEPWEGRPMLRTAPDPRQAVERLLTERAPGYAQADWSLDTSELTPHQVVDRICEKLPSLCRARATES